MTHQEDTIIEQALLILERRLKARAVFSDPDEVKSFLRLQSRGLGEEIFAVMYLDGERRLIEYERQASVDPRNVAEKVLINTAASVIVHHNHAGGSCWPSLTDHDQALRVQETLALLRVPVLDHVITSDQGLFSVAERSFG